MISFRIEDMTCGHCVRSITGAVQAIDPSALVHADLSSHRVDIESSRADAPALRQAIEAAGFTPVTVSDAVIPAEAGARRTGCCCG